MTYPTPPGRGRNGVPRVEDLPEWPVYDTPYEVTDMFGSYVEVLLEGCADDALTLPEPRAMIVAECTWGDEYTRRTVHRVKAISGPRSRFVKLEKR